MDELQQRIESVLNDPQQMKELLSLARSLGAELPEELQESAAQPETESPQEPMKGLGALMSQPLGALLQSAGKLEQKQEALLNALRPFLKPNRREKLDRAIRAARLSQLAGRALKSRNENDLP